MQSLPVQKIEQACPGCNCFLQFNYNPEMELKKKKKKECCEKYKKKGKRCKSCPGRVD